jgi:phosphatidylserine decarboxylase
MENSTSVRFLYGTAAGRAVLKVIQRCHLDRLAVWFLCSPLSRPMIPFYIRRHQIPMADFPNATFSSFRAFFVRRKTSVQVDTEPSHLISPCDGYLSVFPIREDSSFAIKGSRYRLCDLLQDPVLCHDYDGGDCLIFRLCASDYHHYCYIDDGEQGPHHAIPGQLHSVQPIACATYPVYTLNRRVWSLLSTAHFGPVVQAEIGALIVGGIHNEQHSGPICRGAEKGYFELSGSTIVLLFQKDRVRLLPALREAIDKGQEVRVTMGMWIGEQAP